MNEYVKYEVILRIHNTCDWKCLALSLDVFLEIPSRRVLNCRLFQSSFNENWHCHQSFVSLSIIMFSKISSVTLDWSSCRQTDKAKEQTYFTNLNEGITKCQDTYCTAENCTSARLFLLSHNACILPCVIIKTVVLTYDFQYYKTHFSNITLRALQTGIARLHVSYQTKDVSSTSILIRCVSKISKSDCQLHHVSLPVCRSVRMEKLICNWIYFHEC